MDITLIRGIECGGGCEAKRRRWSHRLGLSTGYGDAHQLMSMQGVGIAMQRMH